MRIVLFSVCAMACLSVPVSALQLLANGDFNTNGFEGWYIYIQNPANCWVDLMPISGGDSTTFDKTSCARLIGNEADATGPGAVIGQVITFEPNSMPTLDFRCVVTTQWTTWGSATASIDYYLPDGTWLSYSEFRIFENTNIPTKWTTYTHAFAVPPEAGRLDFKLRSHNWVKGAYFDNVSLEYIDRSQALLKYPEPGQSVPWEDRARCGSGPTLHWLAAGEATGRHMVFVGTTAAAVANATTSDPEFRGTTPLSDPNYILPLDFIEKGQAYYWRIDETTPRGVIKGDSVRSFTISKATTIDGFAYASEADLQSIWSGNPALENGAMRIYYDNTSGPYLTEAGAEVSKLQTCLGDWTRGGNALLMLEVKGHDNMKDSLGVTLESNSGAQRGTVYYPDIRELNQQSYEGFRTWIMDLGEFGGQGVDLGHITKFSIGIGNKSNPAAGGSGAVWVDNIRLSIPECLAGRIPADINGDCVVNLDDLMVVVSNWMRQGPIVTAAAPVRGPVLWYKFDEGAGDAATDSSGFGYHGLISRATAWAGAGTGYDGSDCLKLENLTWVAVPIAAANLGDPNYPPSDPNQYPGATSTVSLWLKDPGQTDADSELFQIGQAVSVWVAATGNFWFNAGGDSVIWGTPNYTNPLGPQDQWVHYAFVKSATAGTLRIYRNGTLVVDAPGGGTWSPVVDGVDWFFSIGAWRWSGGSGGYLDGLMDDFRLYDYALSDSEVLSLAQAGGTASSPLLQPLLTGADIVPDNAVGLQDFAEVAARWLEPAVYP